MHAANPPVMRSVNPLRLVRTGEHPPPAASSSRRELPLEAQALLIVTICLTVFGQLMVYSASSAYAMTHAEFNFDSLYFIKSGVIYTAAGVGLMIAMIFVPAGWLKKLAPIVFVGSLLGLAAVRMPGVGVAANGASRWLALGPFTIQPSEFAKLGTLLVVALILANRRTPPETMKELAMPLGLLVGLVCALIMVQPDLGTTLAVVIMVFAILIAAGVREKILAQLLGIGLVVGAVFIYAAPYRRDRIFAFLDPWGQSADGAYQVVQSMIAVGSGGIFGVGLGGSVQKVNFLPEAHTDMIFAVIGEELGLIGALLVVGLFAAFAWAGYTIASRTVDPFQRLLAAGATALIVGQAIVNLGAVMGILPLTGIPLPLISYGSSSRLVILALVGILIAISREPQLIPGPRRTAKPDPGAPTPTKPRAPRKRQPVGA